MPQMPCVHFLRNQIIFYMHVCSFYECETTGCFYGIGGSHGGKSKDDGRRDVALVLW